jgi:hypothetical protein
MLPCSANLSTPLVDSKVYSSMLFHAHACVRRRHAIELANLVLFILPRTESAGVGLSDLQSGHKKEVRGESWLPAQAWTDLV